MAHLDSVRKDMVILEKSEFANLRSENTVRRLYFLFSPSFSLIVQNSCLTSGHLLESVTVSVLLGFVKYVEVFVGSSSADGGAHISSCQCTLMDVMKLLVPGTITPG